MKTEDDGVEHFLKEIIKQMGSRLRPVPEKVLECLIEVSAPSSESEGPTLLSYYPESYEDVEMLQNVVTKFCFPFEQDAEMVDAVQHFTFVLTDIDGLYRFGFCRYPPKARTCLCILSDLPAFDMFYGMLNTIAELENNAKNEVSQVLTVNQFLDLVLEKEIPKPGSKLTITAPKQKWKKEYKYPDPDKLPSIPENRNLTDYFSALNPINMIALFASMMWERRIIITSKKLSLLTACTYSASSLLYPMHWQHVFIPVIPPSLLDYCCAPMPFLIGVHSSLMKRVRDMPLDDVVILDVDKNEIEVPFKDVDNLPSEAVHKLNSALKKSEIAIGDYVSRAFLTAVVVLIGGYRDALKLSSETIVFEKELFVNSRPHIKPFLENLLTLQLFERFVHHRLQQLNAGEAIDDAFEEQVGLQTENDSKWSSQYKQWVKNRKRDLSNLSGKTEKATHKANKFIQAGFKNVKNHGKYGWKEAVKGLKETKKNFIEYVKKPEMELDEYEDEDLDKPGSLTKSNSLPMRKINNVKTSPMPSRKSLGSALHDKIGKVPSDPKKSPCPSRPPPRVPTRATPPPRPPPFKLAPAPSSETNSPGIKVRESMCRDPRDPPVKDLINFFDSQEDLAENGSSRNLFADFKEFNYKSDNRNKEAKSSKIKTNCSSSDGDLTRENEEGLLWDTMISLSDDTRQFLRDSRLDSAEVSESAPLESKNDQTESPPRLRRKTPVKKTLRELALDHKTESKNCLLTHAESCPSLFDPLSCADNSDNLFRSSPSSSKTCVNGLSSNVDLLLQVEEPPPPKTNCDDPFVELIARRHNLKAPGLSVHAPQRSNNPLCVANFE